MSYVELRNRNVTSKKSAIESAFTTLGKTARPAKSVSAKCNFSSYALAGMIGRASHQETCKKQSKAHSINTGKITHPFNVSKQRLWEPSQAALQSEVGEQWEEFLRYALELQRQLAKESSVSLEPEPPLPRQRMMDVPAENKSVLQRLFKRESPVAGTKSNFAKLWKDYAAYGNIEEV
ncbi:MAG: hypothetical protein FRX49_10629 [Trebouxia sp. A1-2]|nr:MAG: hypothetical protein FRX49_10629 [Trebouxia sp. A1-2]